MKINCFFHKLSYSFSVIHMFNEKWTFVGRISPTLASDFEDKLSGHDFILQGTASLTKRFSPNILGGVGLIYTTRLGKPRLYPSIQYQYRMGKHDLNIIPVGYPTEDNIPKDKWKPENVQWGVFKEVK